MRPVSSTSLRPHQSSSSRCMSNIFLHPAVEDAKACGSAPRFKLVIGKTAGGWTNQNASPRRSCHDARALACHADDGPMPPAGRGRGAETPRRAALAADAEALDERPVARLVLLLDVVEKRAALRNHFPQAATGVVVLHMGLEMVGQIGDPLSEDRDLDFRRPGVADLQGILVDERRLALGGNRHRAVPCSFGGAGTRLIIEESGRAGMSSRSVAR